MPLFADLSVNDDRIGRFKISRRGKLRAGKKTYTYHYIAVTPDGTTEGEVQHRYDDGAWKLLDLCVKDAGF